MSVLLGVVGGSSRSEAIAFNEGTGKAYRASGGCLAYRWTDSFDENIGRLLNALAEKMSTTPAELVSRIRAATLALSGIVGPSDSVIVRSKLHNAGFVLPRLNLIEDIEAVFPAESLSSGIVVYVASGVNVMARGVVSTSPRSIRVDGWGPILGDDGGAFSMGLSALRAAMRFYDHRCQECGKIAAHICSQLELASADALLGWFDQSRKSYSFRSNIASLADSVFRSAASGDDSASLRIVEVGATRIAQSVATVWQRCVSEGVNLGSAPTTVLAGRLFLAHPAYALSVREKIASHSLSGNIRSSSVTPALGALLDVCDRVGLTLDGSTRGALVSICSS